MPPGAGSVGASHRIAPQAASPAQPHGYGLPLLVAVPSLLLGHSLRKGWAVTPQPVTPWSCAAKLQRLGGTPLLQCGVLPPAPK